jgi:hypothetical protein
LRPRVASSLAVTRTAAARDARRVERGDWQTPQRLADAIVERLGEQLPCVGSVLEPTCGQGAFLRAAARALPGASLVGYDISEHYVAAARAGLPTSRARIRVADFFQVEWEKVLRALPEPVLVVGNPPWVTNAALGALGAGNLPRKSNARKLKGLDAITGKSNFDISEWMIVRLLEAALGRDFVLAMLCKASVARRVMEQAATRGWGVSGELRAIDARLHFGAAVDAVLLTIVRAGVPSGARRETRWPIYESLDASTPSRHMGVVDGRAVSDLDGHLATRALEGRSEIEWRSGIKHDCARVMELDTTRGDPVNGLGETIELEPEYLYPLLKGSDLARGRTEPRRMVIVTQRSIGEDTAVIRARAPGTWAYLSRHAPALAARKSSIYRGQPAFAIFGVGAYSFAPYKVAISGLYKRLTFSVVEPVGGKPVMLDDTCYFLPCDSLAQAREIAAALSGARAEAFFGARVFWDAKRPIGKALLQSLSLGALLRLEGASDERSRSVPRGQVLR